MRKDELTPNLRVEYAARAEITVDGKKVRAMAKRQFVGYVKRVYRKWLTTYVVVCESRTRRIDTVKLKDVFGVVADRIKPINKINNNDSI